MQAGKISDSVLQNLKDAGCPEQTIRAFAQSESGRQQLEVLALYRKKMLDGIHAEQKKLDCLDYLIFKIKEKKQEGERSF